MLQPCNSKPVMALGRGHLGHDLLPQACAVMGWWSSQASKLAPIQVSGSLQTGTEAPGGGLSGPRLAPCLILWDARLVMLGESFRWSQSEH